MPEPKYVWSVATGRISLFQKASIDAVQFMSKQKGFVAIQMPPGGGTLFLYNSLNNAKGARNLAEAKGIQCGLNICRFRHEGDTIVFDDPNYKEDSE